jgi:hypothetical protein
MNRAVVFAAIAVLGSGSMVFAGGDKASTPFADTSSVAGGANGFTNGTSSGVSKSGGCTIQIQLKKLNTALIPDGANVICVGSADVLAASLPPGGAGNSVVWVSPAKAGGVKIKNSVAVLDVGGQHCGSSQTVSFNSGTTCYLPDPGYDPATACQLPAALWVPNPDPTSQLKGLCQGFALGYRIPAPSSGKIAETAMTILTGAK